MKILNAKYGNSEGSVVLVGTEERGEVMLPLEGPDCSVGVRAAYLAWLAAGNVPLPFVPLPVDSIQLAEEHIGRFFSTPKLLQMKMWWDATAHEATPKLAATYAWSSQVTAEAVGGATQFAEAPFSFAEIAAECVALMERKG